MREVRTALQSNIESVLASNLAEVLQGIPQTKQLLGDMSADQIAALCTESAAYMHRIVGTPVFQNMESWTQDSRRVVDAAMMGLQQTEQFRPLMTSPGGTEIRIALAQILSGRMYEHCAAHVFSAVDDIDLSRTSLQ